MEQTSRVTFEQYAIFQTGGKQYQAVPGQALEIEKIEGERGAAVSFSEVLFRKSGEDAFEVGQPYVKNAEIKAEIIMQTKGAKVIVFKFKRRKKYRTKQGHRQLITVIRVKSI
ncbi:MAG: 50S ribosomal protein L21 [Candidatus Babeliales bacterium]|jgi:large subunit ribosomal protein L21